MVCICRIQREIGDKGRANGDGPCAGDLNFKFAEL